MGQLDDAVKAHRDAQAALDAAKEQARKMVEDARDRAEQTRQQLADAIVAETLGGTPQIEIIRRTGYSREAVRLILRKRGVEPG